MGSRAICAVTIVSELLRKGKKNGKLNKKQLQKLKGRCVKMTQKFSKDDRLGFALNYCIGGFEHAVADLPRGASDEEIKQSIKKVKACIGMLMIDVRRIECEMENVNLN